MKINFKGYKSNYNLFIDGQCFFRETDFSVGDGDEYDFTVQECLDADIPRIEEYFGGLDSDTREAVIDILETYYDGHDN